MIINKKRVVSLFIALVLVLSFSLQTLASAEKPAEAQELIEESTVNELSPDLLIVPTDESLKVDEEKPKPQLEPELKPDPKADEVTLGASGQEEKPAANPVKPGVYATQNITINFNWNFSYDDSGVGYFPTGNNGPMFDYLGSYSIDYTGNSQAKDNITRTAENMSETAPLIVFNNGTNTMISDDVIALMTAAGFTNSNGQPVGTIEFSFTSDSAVPNKADSCYFSISFESIESTITPNPNNPVSGYNPVGFTGDSVYGDKTNNVLSKPITQTWVITGPNNYSKTVTGDNIDSLFVYDQSDTNHLKTGTYTVKLSGAGETVNGTVVPDDYINGATTTFSVQYPTPTVAIDKAENPTSVEVIKEFIDSTYTWQVYEWDGTTETPVTGFSGTGASTDISTTLDLPTIKDLAAGSYRVRIVETDATHSVIKGEAFDDFTIVDPLVKPALVGGFTTTPGSVALPANPTSGTGTPKFTDSTVTWEILDKNGSPLTTPISGSTTVELEAAYKTLPEGEYKLQYTETATYNGRTHSDSVPFQIINPLTSSAVDKPTNPTLGTGTQKMPAGESMVTWEILDSNNQIVGSGTGLTVPKAEFDKLPNGDYKLKFTETSSYNQAVHSHEAPFNMDITTPIAKGTLEVKHIFLDEKGNLVTTPATITNKYTGDIGTPYSTTPLIAADIPAGYRLVQSKLPANASDTYKTTPTVVEYYYEPIPKVQPGQGTVTTVHTIQHTDGSVTAYATEDPIIDKIGKPYATTPIAIPGYILKEVPSNDDGTIATGNQTVTYVYIPDPTQAQLTEQHLIVDGAGNVIGVVDVVATARPDGTPYTTTAKAPAGYKLVTNRAPANANGTYKTGEERVVSYYYAKIADPVTPNPGTGGGSWTPNGWTNRPSTNPNADKSPNVARITGVTTSITPEAGTETSPTEGGNSAQVSGSKDSDSLNPQTGDSTNQESILNILYVVLIGALAIFVLNVLLPRKKQKR